MRNKRRRIFYIDRVFQKRLLMLFLGLNLIVVAANIVFYFTYLKGAVEANLFRSHISIGNVNEVIAGGIVDFNILLAILCFVLVILFYVFTRWKLRSFLEKVKQVLSACRSPRELVPGERLLPRHFQEIDHVMEDFTRHVTQKSSEEELRIQKIKEAVKSL